MSVYSCQIRLQTSGEVDIIDITPDVAKEVKRSKIKDGLVCVFEPGATGAVTTIEYEDGLFHGHVPIRCDFNSSIC